jgi:hypothetical protein
LWRSCSMLAEGSAQKQAIGNSCTWRATAPTSYNMFSTD